MEKLFQVVHEDRDLLVVNKPAGLVCHPTKGDVYSSLIGRVRLHLGTAGEPQLINRLDRETSGLVLVAKTPTAARAVRRIWEAREVRKEYLALVHGWVAEEQGTIDAPLGRNVTSLIAIKDCVRSDGAAAQTEYEVRFRFQRAEGKFTGLRVRPRTGRKHQIRIHLAHLGHPIVGDKMYGGDDDLYLALVEDRLTEEQRGRLILPYHALHAEEVVFAWQGVKWEFRAAAESWLVDFYRLPISAGNATPAVDSPGV